jgi:hypothetical protein
MDERPMSMSYMWMDLFAILDNNFQVQDPYVPHSGTVASDEEIRHHREDSSMD